MPACKTDFIGCLADIVSSKETRNWEVKGAVMVGRGELKYLLLLHKICNPHPPTAKEIESKRADKADPIQL